MKIAFVYMNKQHNIGRGAGYVASAILQAGYDLEFFDTCYTPGNIIASQVKKGNFDILMVSSTSIIFPEALELIRKIKSTTDIKVLLGGVHATIVREKLLEQHPEIDYLCVGEGESFILDFLENFGKESLLKIPNLAYRSQGAVQTNPLRPVEDLSTLPPFRWDLFNPSSIVVDDGFIYVTGSRGCPYNCTYCCNGLYLKYYGKSYLRYRPISDILEELKELDKTYSPHLFYFGDEMLLTSLEQSTQLFQTIQAELKKSYGLMARVEHINPASADLLASTGCKYVGIGVECGNEEFRRKYLNRQMSNQQIKNAVSLLKKKGISVTSFNMIGYPFANDDFLTEETVALNKEINPDTVQISIYYPFIGTKLYERCREMDLIDARKAQKFTADYYTESILKNVQLKDKLESINLIFDPQRLDKQPSLLRRTAANLLPDTLKYYLKKILRPVI